MSEIAVGSSIESYCTKCKLVLAHTVVSLTVKEDKPKRVQCNTCNGEHNYRATKPGTKKTTGTKAKKPRSTTKKTRQSWQDIMKEAADKPHKKYILSGSFDEGDWIEHSTFGLGCVQSFTPPNKITVRFSDSTRLLVCNHS